MGKEAILKRMAEIKTELEGAGEVDLEGLETELRELDDSLKAIEKREEMARQINTAEVEVRKVEKPDAMEKEAVPIIDTPEYRSAWLKRLQGRELNEIEQRSIAATNVSGAIPTQTSNKILTKIRETVPLLSEITLLHVAGNVNFAVEGTNNDAALHTESGELTAQEDTLVTVSLGGYEIAKLVRISQTVKTMTINAFEGWLSDILAENIATKIEYYVIYGTGDSQPKGINAANSWTDGTNGVDWASTAPTYKELCELIGYLPGGYARKAKWLMNHKTFWNDIQAVRDDSKARIVEKDGNTYRVMGYPVLFSDYVADGEMFFGDYSKVVANLSQDITVKSSEHSAFIYNAIDYRGAAMFDCDIAIANAFVKGEATLA